jgi:membrane protein DedA with SNARE-associated domain
MDAFQEFAREFAIYGYPLLFVGVLLENAGIPLPGETAVLAAGFLSSSAGGGHFSLFWVILTVLVAAVLGDNFGFWLGYRFARPRLARGKGFLFLTPRTLALAEGYFQHYGIWTIFFARFVAGLRIVGALAAGTANMRWTHFFAANAAGALAWSTAITLLGYFFGNSWELLHHWMGRGALIVLACVVVLVGLRYLLHRFEHSPRMAWDYLARAQLWHGVLAAGLEVVCIALLMYVAEGHERAGLRAADNPGAPQEIGEPRPKFDQRVDEYITLHADNAWINNMALAFSYLGSLPTVLILAAATLVFLRGREAPIRHQWALAWAIVGSEIVGLCLLQLLRSRDLHPVRTGVWPFGFSGLIALRALAVFGMIAHVLAGPLHWRPLAAYAAALVPPLLAGAGVLWLREQTLTEIGLEFVSGALVLYAGVWWAEGYGLGLVPLPPRVDRTPEHPTIPVSHDEASLRKREE